MWRDGIRPDATTKKDIAALAKSEGQIPDGIPVVVLWSGEVLLEDCFRLKLSGKSSTRTKAYDITVFDVSGPRWVKVGDMSFPLFGDANGYVDRPVTFRGRTYTVRLFPATDRKTGKRFIGARIPEVVRGLEESNVPM
jgi:hypothetical protein